MLLHISTLICHRIVFNLFSIKRAFPFWLFYIDILKANVKYRMLAKCQFEIFLTKTKLKEKIYYEKQKGIIYAGSFNCCNLCCNDCIYSYLISIGKYSGAYFRSVMCFRFYTSGTGLGIGCVIANSDRCICF